MSEYTNETSSNQRSYGQEYSQVNQPYQQPVYSNYMNQNSQNQQNGMNPINSQHNNIPSDNHFVNNISGSGTSQHVGNNGMQSNVGNGMNNHGMGNGTDNGFANFQKEMMTQMRSILSESLGLMNKKMDNTVSLVQEQTENLKAAVVNNQLLAEERNKEVDRRFEQLEERQTTFENNLRNEVTQLSKKLYEGTKLARKGSDKILWMRGYPTDNEGRPLSLSPYRNILPRAFYEWVLRVSNTRNGNFMVEIRPEVQCTNYKLGVLMAKYDAQFRKVMPNFDTRTLREIQTGVPLKGNRYYKEERHIDQLQNLAIDFVLEEEGMADGSQNISTFV